MYKKQLNIAADMYGCPNRCRHCWIGHMPNRIMDDDADRFIMEYFSPYFEKIAFYSWLREPDYCDNYRERWERDVAVSKNAVPERFELASFYRIVRDREYIDFLRDVGTKKVQLTLFGSEVTTDRYVGRKGANREILKATDLLIENGIIPRWQCFINEENKDEITYIYRKALEIRKSRCPGMEFFVHEGSCDGENRKLYQIRINKQHIPKELMPVYLDHDKLTTERDCCRMLEADMSHPGFHNDGDITLYISNNYDVYFNFTNMSRPWVIGNLRTDTSCELVRRIVNEDTYALNEAEKVTWSELCKEYGDPCSDKVFSLGDYKIYLFNNYLEDVQHGFE